jgi:hypothetical protein
MKHSINTSVSIMRLTWLCNYVACSGQSSSRNGEVNKRPRNDSAVREKICQLNLLRVETLAK